MSSDRVLHTLRRMLARNETIFTANTFANELWPNARQQNNNGQAFNLAAGVAGRMLRRYRFCYEIRPQLWEIIPEKVQALKEEK